MTAVQDGPATDRAAYPLDAQTELARLGALHGYGLLDQPRQEELDALARIAAYVCGTPTAVVNLLDADRQWQAAAHGCPTGQVPREASMCARTVLAPDAPDVTFVPDASLDPRFEDNPFVTGAVGEVRLYASVPLRAPGGHVLGSLCAFDSRPGELSAEQLDLLQDLGRQVVQLFELRRVGAVAGRLALTDPLTGLPNRRQLERYVAGMLARGERAAIGVCDLIGFSAVNARHGRHCGDLVLQRIAGVLNRVMRRGDFVARFAGDEFVVVLPGAGPTQAAEVSRRIRSAAASENWQVLVPGTPIGLAAGWSEVGRNSRTLSSALAAAAASRSPA